MNLTARIFAGYLAIALVGAFFLFRLSVDELKPIVRQSTEESLVETANLLAAIVHDDVVSGQTENGVLRRGFDEVRSRSLGAKIWGTSKARTNERVYVTDRNGIVLFDSDGKGVGQDYSKWRDVALTLRGEYGARSTRAIPEDDLSTVMHVAAPIVDHGVIIGVLTVAKPNATAVPFLERGRRELILSGAILLALSVALGLALSFWLTSSLRKLSTYARSVSEGKRIALPQTTGELAELASALETMRIKLEGKEYVEKYVHTLTHELKGPLTAVSGAAELLGEEMDASDRTRFVANIRGESRRMLRIVERLLELAVLESRRELRDVETIGLRALVEETLRARETDILGKELATEVTISEGLVLRGERFLLEQALLNLVDNAVAFSKRGGALTFSATTDATGCTLSLRDHGSGIPDYARERVFERFYSLPRPDTDKKGTGIGLNFVSEVAELHDGSVSVENHPEGGAIARLRLGRRLDSSA